MEGNIPLRDDNRGPLLLQYIWTGVGIASIFVAARAFTRVTVSGGLKWDDHFMGLALVFRSQAPQGITDKQIADLHCCGNTYNKIGQSRIREALGLSKLPTGLGGRQIPIHHRTSVIFSSGFWKGLVCHLFNQDYWCY